MAVGKNELTLELGKHFLIIDSKKSFTLEDNQGFRAYRPAGAWQIDCWKLLPEEWHKIYPVYTLKIEWVNSEADKDYIPTINATDLDLGDGIAGVSGQPVNVTTPVEVANLPNVIVGEQNTVPVHIETNLQPLEVVSHANNVIDGFEWIDLMTGSETADSINDYLHRAFGGFVGRKSIYVKNFFVAREAHLIYIDRTSFCSVSRSSSGMFTFIFPTLIKRFDSGVSSVEYEGFNIPIASYVASPINGFALAYKNIEEKYVPDEV